MAARKTPSGGGKPDKLMRDALRLALHREAKDAEGNKTKKLNIVAAKLVELACEGDVQAIKEINDRIDGKVPQGIQGELNHSVDDPLGALLMEIAKAGSRLGGNDQP